jgi:hypothetical protein
MSFRAVEKIHMYSGEVLDVFSSASVASRALKGSPQAFRIVNACQSKRRDDREAGGFFWRFQGSKDRILVVGENINDGVPIEQINLETKRVMKLFSSSRLAAEQTGVSRCSIRRVLDRKGKANAGGYFWRYAGEEHGPWKDPEPTNLNPVEKLCLQTGDVLEEFESLAAAKRAMNMAPNSGCIRDVCEGKGRKSSQGFFWRWTGSDKLPEDVVHSSKTVQMLRSKNGPVVKEFPSATLAAQKLGIDMSGVARWCRNQSKERGFWWRYNITKLDISEEEKVVGKRLRVRHGPDNTWYDGRVEKFDRESKKHVIVYDSGKTEKVILGQIVFELKSDQGQKPIEKLSFETGEVLETYDSISDAAYAVGTVTTRVTSVLRGKSKSCRGFFWRYKGSSSLPLKRKMVAQICLKTGRVLATYKTIKEAAQKVGITTPGISYCCNGRNGSVSAGGFGWKSLKEERAIRRSDAEGQHI